MFNIAGATLRYSSQVAVATPMFNFAVPALHPQYAVFLSNTLQSC